MPRQAAENGAIEAKLRDAVSARCSTPPIASAASRTRSNRARRGQGEDRRRCSPTKADAALARQALQGAREGHRARRHPATASRASTAATPRPCGRSSAEVGILPRAHGSALFTRGETQALVVTTLGTGQDEQIIDALEGEYPRKLHAALQLPALFDRRSGPHGLARPPRDRPWQARLARGPSAAAGEGEVPLHDPRRLGDHRIQRLVVDGHGVRRLAVADGCRRAAAAAGRGHRHGPDQGRRGLRRALRHPRRRGSSRRHGLQGRRHRAGRHRAADGHQDHLDHRGDHEDRAGPGAATAACTSSARWPRR